MARGPRVRIDLPEGLDQAPRATGAQDADTLGGDGELARRKASIPIGVLFSRTGSYALLGEAMRAGAFLAIEEIAADPAFPFAFSVCEADPGGETARYAVVGCYTSSSRKEILPLFEKHDALLWYPSHYEGFESSENVIYSGAAPNQHVTPLTRWMVSIGRRRAFLVGSNYIWAWENNRVMRETLTQAGGEIVGERYAPVGERDLAALVTLILNLRPDFVFNTLIGESAYEFFRLLRAMARARGIDQPREMPVASCSLAEPELTQLGDAADGHISSSVYFSTVRTCENARFSAAWTARYPALGLTSADAEASYVAVHLLARAIRVAGSADFEAVRRAAGEVALAAPQGPVRVDPDNRHCWLHPRIGRSTADGRFEILHETAAAVRPDPYLVWEQPARQAKSLRLVQ
jgi:branched-chain amino acid transport system substrate-binding protein